MSNNTSFTIRTNQKLKEDVQAFLEGTGISVSFVVNQFLKQMLEKNKIELLITPNKIDLTEIDFDDLSDFEKKEYARVSKLPNSDLTTTTLE